LFPALAPAAAPENFNQAKTRLVKIHRELARQFPEAKRDFYCQCRINSEFEDSRCEENYFTKSGKQTLIQDTTLSWEHVLPANLMEQTMGVNRENTRQCRLPGDFVKPFPPWEACDTTEEQARVRAFHALEGNLYNLVPSALTPNMARRNYPLVPLPGQERLVGCPLRVAKANNIKVKEPKGKQGFLWKEAPAWQAEIPLHKMGLVSRIYLYLDAAYPELRLQDQLPHSDQWTSWNQQFPPSEFECARYRLILKETNQPNPVMAQACLPQGLAKQE